MYFEVCWKSSLFRYRLLNLLGYWLNCSSSHSVLKIMRCYYSRGVHPFKKSESRASVLHTTSESAPPATESQNSDLGFLNSITSKKTHPNSASCVPSPSFPWGSQLLRLKLYMAFAPSHVQFDFDSPRSRWSGGGSATARRWSFSRLNRPHDRRFRVLGPYDPPTSLIQGPPSPQH